MGRGIKIVAANIFQTEVGYTVVMTEVEAAQGVRFKSQFRYMDPTGNYDLELIIQTVYQEGCSA